MKEKLVGGAVKKEDGALEPISALNNDTHIVAGGRTSL